MESCIKDELMKYLLENSLITRHQHGFISKRSTCTQLLECIQDWQFEITNKITTDVLYIDFARAFDSVVHSKLLVKLKSYGIGYELLNWFQNFLTGRSQMVVIDGHLSTSVNVISGVPQGSVIGPILFILFVNDIVDILPDSVHCKLFADDIKLYSSVDISLPINSLHVALDLIVEWANIWQMPINASKCNVLHIGSKFVQSSADYFIKQQKIVRLSEVRDLGILLDDDLRFKHHISQITTKAYQRIAVIFRGFCTRNVTFLIRAYKTYIRPILEYCTQIWNPYLIGEIIEIEKVQKYYTKRLPGMKSLNYNDRLQRLKLESLELRRLKADLMMYYKIVHEIVDLKFDDFFKLSLNNTRSNGYKLLKPFLEQLQHKTILILDVWEYGMHFRLISSPVKPPQLSDRNLTFSILKSATCVFNPICSRISIFSFVPLFIFRTYELSVCIICVSVILAVIVFFSNIV